MKATFTLLLALLVAFGVEAAPAKQGDRFGTGLRILPIGRRLSNTHHPITGKWIADGYTVTAFVINDSSEAITLPSRFPEPLWMAASQSILVGYEYRVGSLGTNAGRYPVIPSREALAPVTLRPKECFELQPSPFTFENEQLRGRKVLFRYSTIGLLAERFGFPAVRIESEMVLIHYGEPLPKELRDPPEK